MVRATARSSAFWRVLSTRTWIESATNRSPSSPAEAVTRLTLKSCQRTSSSDMRRVEDSDRHRPDARGRGDGGGRLGGNRRQGGMAAKNWVASHDEVGYVLHW